MFVDLLLAPCVGGTLCLEVKYRIMQKDESEEEEEEGNYQKD